MLPLCDENHNPRFKRVIVLTSALGVNRVARGRTHRALHILKARGIPHEVVDAADFTQHPQRDALFRLNGANKEYPQFFLALKRGSTSFLGDVGIISRLHDADSLPPTVLEKSPSLVTLSRCLEGNRKLVFLYTSLRISQAVVRRQEMAFRIIAAAGVDHELIDGADPALYARRDALFKKSGRRGVYPQFFVYDDDELEQDDEESVKYLGNLDQLERLNDASELSVALKEAQTPPRSPASVFTCRRAVHV